MNKLLTVSIAAYNVEKYIRETLESLCIPSIIDDLEIFIVDDGGKDGTYEIAKEFEDLYPNTFHAIHKENGGWGSTVNYSIEHASGKYFRLLDGDDYYDRNGLINLIKVIKKTDADVIYTGYRRFDDETKRTVEKFSASNGTKNTTVSVSEVSASDFVMHSSTFKTDILKSNNIRITEHCFYTDNEYRTKAMAYVKNAYITDYSVYQYRVGREGQSIDITGVKKHYKDNLDVLKELIKFEESLPNTCNIEIVNQYINSVIEYHYNNLLLINEEEEYKVFDIQMLRLKTHFAATEKEMQKIIRKTNYRCFAIVSLWLRMRISVARKAKMLMSKVSG